MSDQYCDAYEQEIGRLRSMGITGRDVEVAVIDTGLPFNSTFSRSVGFRYDIPDVESMERTGEHAHAFSVTSALLSVAGGVTVHDLGIINEKVTDKRIAQSLQWCKERALENGVKLIANLSIQTRHGCGGWCPLCKTIDEVSRAGVIVVAATGNRGELYRGGKCTVTCPGSAKSAVSVGEYWGGKVLSHSGSGPTIDGRMKPDLVAPSYTKFEISMEAGTFGRLEKSTHLEEPLPGTSLATPVISGAIALLWQHHSDATAEEVKNILFQNCEILSGVPLHRQGKGISTFYNAIREEKER